MAPPIAWTDKSNARLKELRKAGVTWTKIGEEFGVGRNAAKAQYHRLFNTRKGPKKVQPKIPPGDVRDRSANPLPAGHRISWGILTDGTWLEGTPWPEK
jgi:hypothetical protein